MICVHDLPPLCLGRRPVLVIQPSHAPAAATGVTIRLLPCLAEGTFPLARLAPSRNNLRAVVTVPELGAEGAEPAPAPTPHYNTGILQV